MKRISFVLAGLSLVLLSTHSQSLTGTWTYSNGNILLTMLLMENGTGEFQGLPIKYRSSDGNLTIDDGYQPITYSYQLSQTSLTLTGGGLPGPVIFSRLGITDQDTVTLNNKTIQPNSSSGKDNNSSPGNAFYNSSGATDLTGIWEGQQGKLVFYTDGTLLYNGTSFQYSSAGNVINIAANDGSTTFTYNIVKNQLTLSQNTTSASYLKTSALRPDVIDPQMVGKWCILSTNYNSYSGGSSGSEECITLNADGTYLYSYSASRSSVYGGTANQDSDRGLWKTDGITIVSVSQVTGKTTRYTLSKENAQNGDATIVLGGRKFVTAYNRPGWQAF